MGHERFRSSHFKEQWVVSLQKAIRPLCESGGLTEPKDLEDPKGLTNPFENGSVPLPPTWHLGLKARTPALQAGKDGFNSRRCYLCSVRQIGYAVGLHFITVVAFRGPPDLVRPLKAEMLGSNPARSTSL